MTAIDTIANSLDIPDAAYDKAEARYKDLGEWFDREGSSCENLKPHVYVQGSFRLGTVIRPLSEKDDYDLDLGCRLEQGVTKYTHSQESLKTLIGNELELYRASSGIKEKLEEMHRCWRLQYSDQMSFHMDAVPSIPEDSTTRGMIKEAMINFGSAAESLAGNVAEHAGAITDNRSQNYRRIDPDWRVSNSEGYALWFESRVEQGNEQIINLSEKRAQVDDLPARKWKLPLQRAVQVLKRHRDVMFANDPDGRPISIIITTLASWAYQGESDLESALARILADMDKHVQPTAPRVPNPVNPDEDFADKWPDPKYASHQLEKKFRLWLSQARSDFKLIAEAGNAKFLAEQAKAKFGVTIAESSFSSVAPGIVTSVKKQTIAEAPARPWVKSSHVR